MLHVVHGVALLPDPGDLPAQGGRIGQGVIGEGIERACQHGGRLRLGHMGQHGLAQAGAVKRGALPQNIARLGGMMGIG